MMNQNSQPDSVVTLMTRMSSRALDSKLPIQYLIKLMMACSGYPGFINAELTPSDKPQLNEWYLVQRFRSRQETQAWLDSSDNARIISEIHALPAEDGVEIHHEKAGAIISQGSITTAIATEILPGQERNYADLECRMQAAQAQFPGYRGVHILPPTERSQRMWVTLMRFDTVENLERWMASPERAQLLRDAKSYVKSTDIKQVAGSFPGWIPTDANGNSPPNWKAGLLVLAGLYPIVTFEVRYFMPLIGSLPVAPRDLLANAISVALTTWITMPLFVRCFGGWLFLPRQAPIWQHAKGLLIILGLLALETLAMWNVIPSS